MGRAGERRPFRPRWARRSYQPHWPRRAAWPHRPGGASGSRRAQWPHRVAAALLLPPALLALAAAALLVAARVTPLPGWWRADESTPVRSGLCTVYDRDGSVLAMRRTSDEPYIPVRFEAVDPLLAHATIAAEDRRFRWHPGVDPAAAARAAVQNARAGRRVSGGSTLTQQLVKLHLHPAGTHRDLPTKLREAWWALVLDAHLPKERIIEAYWNRAPYGASVRGVGAAALLYFGHGPQRLAPQEAALLAAIPRSPVRLDPRRDPEAARRARDRILARMGNVGRGLAIDRERPLGLVAPPTRGARLAPHWLARVEATLPTATTVTLPIDAALQERAAAALEAALDALGARGADDAAAMVIHNPTGEVRAWVGSPDWSDPGHGQFDATRAPRQPGSALKPFTYALGFEAGLRPSSLLPDLPLEYGFGSDNFRPRNYTGEYHGPVRARAALANSWNAAAVALVSGLGPERLRLLLRTAGISTLKQPGNSYGVGLTLGDAEVTLADLTAAYACLARGGVWKPRVEVLEARDANGSLPHGSGALAEIQFGSDSDSRSGSDSSPGTDPGPSVAFGPSGGSGPDVAFGPSGGSGPDVAFGPSGGSGPDVAFGPSGGPGPGSTSDFDAVSTLPAAGRILDPRTAFLVTACLADPLARARAFGLDGPFSFPFSVAIKTGTSSDWRDNWAFGYTSEWTVGTWIGRAGGGGMDRVSGTNGAILALREILFVLHDGQPDRAFEEEFPPPPGLCERTICALSGMPSGPDCPETLDDWFYAEDPNGPNCTWHRRIALDAVSGDRARPCTPKDRLRRVNFTVPNLPEPGAARIVPWNSETFLLWCADRGWPVPPTACTACICGDPGCTPIDSPATLGDRAMISNLTVTDGAARAHAILTEDRAGATGVASVRPLVVIADSIGLDMGRARHPASSPPPAGSGRSQSVTRPICRILRPADGSVYALDPSLPRSQQQVALEASAGGRIVRWQVDGRDLGTSEPGGRLFWPLTQGPHRIRATAGELPAQTDEVGIVVEVPP